MKIDRMVAMLAFGTVAVMSVSACTQGTDISTEPEEVAADPALETAPVARIDCEAMGDAALWIETDADGKVSLVTQMQSEMAPDAVPQTVFLEPTGMSAGREGTRLSDESGNVIVWMLDDGTAEVTDNGTEFTCPAG